MNEEKPKLWKRTWFIVLIAIIFPPVGIFLIWQFADWKKSVKVIMTVISAFILLMAIANMTNNNDNNESKDKSSSNAQLSFIVSSKEDLEKDTEFVVRMWGKTSDGEEVDKRYDAKLDKSYRVDYGKGKYTFAIDPVSINTDVNIFKEDRHEIEFDGQKDLEVKLKLELDTDAMKKKQEEKVKKAQEQAAASQQQQQTQQPTQPQGEVAKQYILVTTTNKFHLAGCRGLSRVKPGNSQTITATRSEMIARGYIPCSICNP